MRRRNGDGRLEFRDNAELERYYEEKYGAGGYDGDCVRLGVNVSQIYHEARLVSRALTRRRQPPY